MLPTSTVASLRQIGRPINRQHRAGVCPDAVAYFGWGPGAPSMIGQTVASVPRAGRCCPPSLPQREHLQRAGLAFQVCCAGAAWAILPTSADATAQQAAGAWLRRLYPKENILCTTITPAGQGLPVEGERFQKLHTALGPRPLVTRSRSGPGFTRRPPNFGTREKCGGSCGADPTPLLSCDPYVRAAFFAECIRPKGISQFAETAWCADWASKHGALGVRQCTNAAMGLGAPSAAIARPEAPYPICRTGKDCTG